MPVKAKPTRASINDIISQTDSKRFRARILMPKSGKLAIFGWALFGVTDRTGFTDDNNSDLPRIGEFLFNFLCNIST